MLWTSEEGLTLDKKDSYQKNKNLHAFHMGAFGVIAVMFWPLG